MKTPEWSPFGIALGVILVAIVIISARRQIAAALRRLWTATLGAFFEPKEYDK
jgi:Flp pilus assembly pilin Flp